MIVNIATAQWYSIRSLLWRLWSVRNRQYSHEGRILHSNANYTIPSSNPRTSFLKAKYITCFISYRPSV